MSNPLLIGGLAIGAYLFYSMSQSQKGDSGDSGDSSQDSGATCPTGYLLSTDGTACNPVATGGACPTGYSLTADGLSCSLSANPAASCPDGYTLSDDGTSCNPVGPGDGCPDGYVLSADGQSCEPSGNPCPDGYTLSADGNSCDPVGGSSSGPNLNINTGSAIGDMAVNMGIGLVANTAMDKVVGKAATSLTTKSTKAAQISKLTKKPPPAVEKQVAKLAQSPESASIKATSSVAEKPVAAATTEIAADVAEKTTATMATDVAVDAGETAAEDIAVSAATKTAVSVASDVGEKVAEKVATKVATNIAEKMAVRAAVAATEMAVATAELGATGGLSIAEFALMATQVGLQQGLNLDPSNFNPCNPDEWDGASLPDWVQTLLSAVPLFGNLASILLPLMCVKNSCPDGMENDSDLCYPKPRDGWACVGPLCYKQYPDFDNHGMASTPEDITKYSYTPTGTIPDQAPPGTVKSGLLYYTDPGPNYSVVAGVAWKNTTNVGAGRIPGLNPCKDGETDDGVSCWGTTGQVCADDCSKGWDSCRRKGLLGECYGGCPLSCADVRGIVRNAFDRGQAPPGDYEERIDGLNYNKCPDGQCHVPGAPYNCHACDGPDSFVISPQDALCASNLDNLGGLCYPQVPEGYHRLALTYWEDCPGDDGDSGDQGIIDMGAICQRARYSRGVGITPISMRIKDRLPPDPSLPPPGPYMMCSDAAAQVAAGTLSVDPNNPMPCRKFDCDPGWNLSTDGMVCMPPNNGATGETFKQVLLGTVGDPASLVWEPNTDFTGLLGVFETHLTGDGRPFSIGFYPDIRVRTDPLWQGLSPLYADGETAIPGFPFGNTYVALVDGERVVIKRGQDDLSPGAAEAILNSAPVFLMTARNELTITDDASWKTVLFDYAAYSIRRGHGGYFQVSAPLTNKYPPGTTLTLQYTLDAGALEDETDPSS